MSKSIISYISMFFLFLVGNSASAQISSSEFDSVQDAEIEQLSSPDSDTAIIPGQCDESFKKPNVLSD